MNSVKQSNKRYLAIKASFFIYLMKFNSYELKNELKTLMCDLNKIG